MMLTPMSSPFLRVKFHNNYQGEGENIDYYVEPRDYHFKPDQCLIRIGDPRLG